MKHQHRVHELAQEMWPRCTKVELRNDEFICELAVNRQYDLVDAYQLYPHIQFLNCNLVEDLRSFIRTWGPLYLVQTKGAEDLRVGRVVRRLDEYKAHCRWLRSVKGMLDACRGLQDERESLVEFLAAEEDMDRTSFLHQPGLAPFAHLALQLQFRYEGNPFEWAASADVSTVRRALASSVQTNLRAPSGYGVRVEEIQGGFEIKPSFSLGNLWDALQWMLWLDEWNRWPPLVCPECRKVFRPSTAHKMKYCTHTCAHRATNREWRRKDLRNRKNVLRSKVKGGTNVSRKTR